MAFMCAVAAIFTASNGGASGQATSLPFVDPLFSSNMVLQRDREDPIWGWTTPGAKVEVEIGSRKAKTTADSTGKWLINLPRFPAGGSYALKVSGPSTSQFDNVTFGDVWICSGQSNMEFGVGNGNNASQETAAANFPNIRLYTQPKIVALSPTQGSGGTWQTCTPENIAKQGTWNGFSAVGYFFGRKLNQDIGVPIGLLQSSWGGTIAEAWTPAEWLRQYLPEFDFALDRNEVVREQLSRQNPPAIADQNNPNVPAALYNGMISPITPFAVKGAIWYQGESNAGRANQYRKLLPTMISSWRERFQSGDFPFLIVQLAGWQKPPAQPGEDGWAELREAQMIASTAVPNAGIATAIDVGDIQDIHPKNKQEVGRRLALVAEAKVYGKEEEYYGPVYRSMSVHGSTITLSFDHAKGLKTSDGQAPKGFAISGGDHKWAWTSAKIDGDRITVSSPNVQHPVAVRYAWAAYLDLNLQNSSGLPAFPFRTDDWTHQ
jgi:sialate O-acetylesterase